MSKIEVSKRRSLFAKLKSYCYFSSNNDTMEVTEWVNGEGYDICIDRKSGVQEFSLTHGEAELLTVLLNYKGE